MEPESILLNEVKHSPRKTNLGVISHMWIQTSNLLFCMLN